MPGVLERIALLANGVSKAELHVLTELGGARGIVHCASCDRK
ncbi:MAG TPA: hypothetical protein VG168_14940 [Bryobacteraceae bacterium]|nr:hypothetical protein [Bryobacteraceae bacterium]